MIQYGEDVLPDLELLPNVLSEVKVVKVSNSSLKCGTRYTR